MKLIDILVEWLPRRSGWPKGAEYCHLTQYDRHCLTIVFYHSNVGAGNNSIMSKEEMVFSGIGSLGDRLHDCTVTAEQYEAALAAKSEGWIEWDGGECPVEKVTLIDVRYRDSNDYPDAIGVQALSGNGAGSACWERDGYSNDIIAYRLHKPQGAEQAKTDDEADLNECIGQDAAQVWGGEGKPAIGEKCEHHSGGQWEVVTIAGIYENLVTGFTDYWMVKEDGSSYTVGNPYRFRPIRSEADKRREEAIKDMTLTGWCESAAEEMYDLIAAGKVRGVKLED